jgi:hypothetical protein
MNTLPNAPNRRKHDLKRGIYTTPDGRTFNAETGYEILPPPKPKENAPDELGEHRRLILEWLHQQEAWLRMPHKWRAVHATIILKHHSPVDGLFVGPKRIRREYKPGVSQSTLRRLNRYLDSHGLQESIPQKRSNGSTTTSARYPSEGFYRWAGLPLPERLAGHLGWGEVIPFDTPLTPPLTPLEVPVRSTSTKYQSEIPVLGFAIGESLTRSTSTTQDRNYPFPLQGSAVAYSATPSPWAPFPFKKSLKACKDSVSTYTGL